MQETNLSHLKTNFHTTNREISWLRFNARVLQEARDKRNPLYERIKFLAIFSSNLDEFFRVRVASLRSLLSLKKPTSEHYPEGPERLLEKIYNMVSRQQELFGDIFQKQIMPELAAQGIYVVNETELTAPQAEFARKYFQEKIVPLIRPYFISKQNQDPFLQNRSLYMAVELKAKDIVTPDKEAAKSVPTEYAILEVPSNELGRFLVLPREGKKMYIMFLDDVMRLSLKEFFPRYDVGGAYAVKLTRDAELHIDDEFQGDLLEKIQRGLRNRKRGIPCRFVYDRLMPEASLRLLEKFLRLQPDDLLGGGRYANFSDLMTFPKPENSASLENKPQPPLHIKELDDAKKLHYIIRQKDVMLHYPYHSYDYVLRFLREAAKDANVLAIKITLYRVAHKSLIVEALKEAVRNGKIVTAFVELKARFDEESNFFWAGELERAGVTVLFSFPGLKVHCKLCVITRRENNLKKRYVYLGTGNFNEETAKVYTDFGLFTCNEEIAKEANEVFRILSRKERSIDFKHLLVAPFNMRKQFVKMIDREIKNAHEDKKAAITCKFNSLEDPEMIHKLYEASNAGVRITLLARGICCAIPGVENMSKNIRAASVVDRYLEHARIYIFHNGGDEKIYLASADWMTRNLSHRIEVGFPIYDPALRKEIKDVIDVELSDNVKARIIAKGKTNLYRHTRSGVAIEEQLELYKYYKKRG